MIDELTIRGYKAIDNETLKFKNLTILTGVNSSGKSSVIQSLLMISAFTSNKNMLIQEFIKEYSDFNTNRNRYTNAKEIFIELNTKNKKDTLRIKYHDNINKEITNINHSQICDYENNLFYISANRIGQEELASYDENNKFGTNGKYVFGYFEQNKSNIINDELISKEADSFTLDSQVSFWLQYILDIDLRIVTSKITASQVKVSFNSDGLENISPYNLGAGNSYVAKIIIMALCCRPGNLLIIENPEIHLHPKAQAKLGDFITFIASKNIQIILETHSEHIINKTRYNIYKKKFNNEDVIIHYKASTLEKFIPLLINQNGHFVNNKDSEIEFPNGFFDSTLDELLEIM